MKKYSPLKTGYVINKEFPSGHGFLMKHGYRSIMAYASPIKETRVVNVYSSLDVTFLGMPTGNWKANNAKVIRNNRFAMAAAGNENNICQNTGNASIFRIPNLKLIFK